MERPWLIRVTLSNGETRHLSLHDFKQDVALDKFLSASVPYQGDWLETTDSTVVARAHIVEASLVPQ